MTSSNLAIVFNNAVFGEDIEATLESTMQARRVRVYCHLVV